MIKPMNHSKVWHIPHELRDDVGIEKDHDSKSGICMRMPRIS